MLWLYSWSKELYTKYVKKRKKAWLINRSDLIAMHPTNLGYHLGIFLQRHNFRVMPKLERHDVYHILTDTGTSLPDEIALQYLLLGNGKRSLYQFAMIGIGTILFPEHWKHYQINFNKGKNYHTFHNIDFFHLLPVDYQKLKESITKKRKNENK